MSSALARPSLAAATPARTKRFVQLSVALLLTIAMALYFWVDSRYPSLLKKLHTGKAIHVSGVLSFDALLPVTPAMPRPTRILRTSINWMWTNRIGMAFGICFGAAMLTLLPLLPRRRFRSATANTLLGGVAGMPLGVCANCVAPIGRGMFNAGASPSTVLATMISSPMLNVVVLTMAFSLFPFPVALLRMAVPLLLLGLVPWMARHAKSPIEASCAIPVLKHENWFAPAGTTINQYFKNLIQLAATTVPFMVLAAVLGSLVAELLPTRLIAADVTILGIVLVALVGTFLPVPIAFDVAAAFLIMSRGIPMPYVVTLLCTLGAFSIYPFFILGRTLSWRTSLTVFATVMTMGIAAGLGTLWLHRF